MLLDNETSIIKLSQQKEKKNILNIQIRNHCNIFQSLKKKKKKKLL